MTDIRAVQPSVNIGALSAATIEANLAARPEWAPVVYALLAADESPLYVGSTHALASRLVSHRQVRRSSWWPEVAYVTWENSWTSPRPRYQMECEAIEALVPPYNLVHNYGADIATLRATERRKRLATYVRHEDRWVEAITRRAILSDGFKVLRVADGPVVTWARP